VLVVSNRNPPMAPFLRPWQVNLSTIGYKLTFKSYYELYLTVQLAWHYICKFSIDFVCSFVSKMILQTILGTISSKMATLKFSRDKRFIPKNQRCQQKVTLKGQFITNSAHWCPVARQFPTQIAPKPKSLFSSDM
jgi:hypothetical protein